MPETIAAVLASLKGRPDRLEQFRDLLGDEELREAYHDHVEEVARRQSGHYSAAMNSRAKFYAELVQREGKRLKGPEALDAVDEILRQYPQILNAIDVALSRNDAEQLAVFVQHLAHPLLIKSRFKDGEALFELLLKKAEELDDRALGISARLRYGQFLFYMSRFDSAKEALEQVMRDALAEDDSIALAGALDFLSHVARDQGDLSKAADYLERSLEIYRRLQNRHGICIALFNLSNLARMQFRCLEARELLQESLEIARDERDEWTLSKVVGSLALIAMAEGNLAEAKRGLEQAIAAHERMGYLEGVAIGLGNLANVNGDLGNYTEAEQCYRRTIEIYQLLGKRFNVGLSLNNLAYLLVTNGRSLEARELFSRALAIARELGDQEGVTAALHGQATTAYLAGDYHSALEPLEECIAISSAIGQAEFLGNHYLLRGRIYFALGDYDQADGSTDLALDTYNGIGSDLRIATTLCHKACISTRSGTINNAVGWLLMALAKCRPLKGTYFDEMLLAAGELFSVALKQADSAVMLYALRHFVEKKGVVLSLCYQTELDEGLSQVASLTPEVLSKAKTLGETLSPDELTDYAIKSLEELETELGTEEPGLPGSPVKSQSADS